MSCRRRARRRGARGDGENGGGMRGGTGVRATFRVRPFMSPRRTLIIKRLTTIMSGPIDINKRNTYMK